MHILNIADLFILFWLSQNAKSLIGAVLNWNYPAAPLRRHYVWYTRLAKLRTRSMRYVNFMK